MKKIRTYKNYTLIYELEKEEGEYVISVEKFCASGGEKSTYVVSGTECDLKSLVCRMWRCGVTPMSLVYILEDEGYLPKEVVLKATDKALAINIVRRQRKDSVVNQNKMFVFDNACYGTLCCEKGSDDI